MTGVYPSAPFQDHEWYLAPGSLLVVAVFAVGGDGLRPEPLAFLRRRDAGADAAALGSDLDRRVRICPQVVVPGRVPAVAALGGDDDDVRPVLDVEERRAALDPALRADVVEEQGRRQAGEAVADEAVGRAVDRGVAAHHPAQDGPRPVDH